jgi:hypothetical protein
MQSGATAGSNTKTITVAGSATELALMFQSVPGEPGSTDWATGTATIRVNISTGNNQLNITSCWICRLSSGGSSLGTYGSNTGLSIKCSAGVKTFTVSCSSLTANTSDELYVVIELTNGNMASQNLTVTVDQTNDFPVVSNTTVTPSAIAIPIAQPAHVLSRGVNPGAIAIPIAQPAHTLSRGINPAPIAIPIAQPAHVLSRGVNPPAIPIPIVVPAPTIVGGGVTVTPDAIAIPIALPGHTLSHGVNPAALAIPIAVPAVLLSRGLNPDAIPIPIVHPAATLSRGVNPDALPIPLALPAFTLSRGLNPAALAVPLVLPTPTITVTGGTTVTPSPIAIPFALVAPDTFIRYGTGFGAYCGTQTNRPAQNGTMVACATGTLANAPRSRRMATDATPGSGTFTVAVQAATTRLCFMFQSQPGEPGATQWPDGNVSSRFRVVSPPGAGTLRLNGIWVCRVSTSGAVVGTYGSFFPSTKLSPGIKIHNISVSAISGDKSDTLYIVYRVVNPEAVINQSFAIASDQTICTPITVPVTPVALGEDHKGRIAVGGLLMGRTVSVGRLEPTRPTAHVVSGGLIRGAVVQPIPIGLIATGGMARGRVAMN